MGSAAQTCVIAARCSSLQLVDSDSIFFLLTNAQLKPKAIYQCHAHYNLFCVTLVQRKIMTTSFYYDLARQLDFISEIHLVSLQQAAFSFLLVLTFQGIPKTPFLLLEV